MFLYGKTHGSVKNDHHFFHTLKTADRKMRENCSLSIKS